MHDNDSKKLYGLYVENTSGASSLEEIKQEIKQYIDFWSAHSDPAPKKRAITMIKHFAELLKHHGQQDLGNKIIDHVSKSDLLRARSNYGRPEDRGRADELQKQSDNEFNQILAYVEQIPASVVSN